ncbi:hypothetical protein P879_02846 [Paragonimus westermani]|uniref:Uncharacterized protein n=1 Tax=Paragonimus westermani TaxID=34504 RepID=A0A8T0DI35_9TREM|nr:hypothetical protein P879_02846 [Paragonimus westermani]
MSYVVLPSSENRFPRVLTVLIRCRPLVSLPHYTVTLLFSQDDYTHLKMGDVVQDGVQIGGPPASRKPNLDCSPLQLLLLGNLVIAIVLGIVGVTQNRNALTPTLKQQLDISLAFSIIGLLSGAVAIISQVLLLFDKFSKSLALPIVFVVFVGVTFICFAIATGVSYKDLVVYTGAWLLSAAWIAFVSLVMTLIFFFMDLKQGIV